MSYAVPGVSGAPSDIATEAVVQGILGVNEELLSRGIVLYALLRLGAVRGGLWSAALFGVGHFVNTLAFGSPFVSTAIQVADATAAGIAYAGMRLFFRHRRLHRP